MEFETKIGGGLSSNPAFKALVLEFIRTLLTSEREKVLTEVQGVIENMEKNETYGAVAFMRTESQIYNAALFDLSIKVEELKNKILGV